MGKTSYEVNKRYKDKVYQYVSVTLRKDDNFKTDWQEYAKSNNMSLNQLIIKATNEYIKNNK